MPIEIGIPGPQGPSGLNWRLAWSATTTYAIGDGVSYEGASYIALSVSINVIPGTAPDQWDMFAESGSLSDAAQAAIATAIAAAQSAATNAAGSATTAEGAATTATNEAATATSQAGLAEAAAATASSEAGAATAAATTATNEATAATTQAGLAAAGATTATNEAAIATTQAGISTTGATTATTQAGISTTQAAASTASATASANSAAVATAAAASKGNYTTVALGLAGTTTGQSFTVTPATVGIGLSDLYNNVSGAAVYQGTTASGPVQQTLVKNTSDVTYGVSRFSPLSVAVVDKTTGLVISGFAVSGALIGAGAVANNALAATVSDLSHVSRFSSLNLAVVDSTSGLVIGGIRATDGKWFDATSALSIAANIGSPPAASLVHVGGLGQSTIIGGAAPAITLTQPFSNLMFDAVVNPVTLTAFNPLVSAGTGGTSGETIFPGWTAAYNAKRATPVPMLATVEGTGGSPIVSSVKGQAHYTNLMAEITAAIALAKTRGDNYLYLGTAFYQGQGDDALMVAQGTAYATEYAYYLGALQGLANDLNNDIRLLTGQTYQVVFYVQQISTWVSTTFPMAALAHYQAMKNMPGLLTIVGPAYQITYAVGSTGEHPDAYSYRRLGEYFAKATDYVTRTGKVWKPVYPTSVKKFGTLGVIVRMNQPNGYTLTIDTVNVTDPNGQKGFELLDDSGAIAISSVTQIGDADFHLVAARAITTNPVLNYACTVALNASGGPITGPRGCIRNTDPSVSYYPDVNGNPFTLYDWCVHFSEKVL